MGGRGEDLPLVVGLLPMGRIDNAWASTAPHPGITAKQEDMPYPKCRGWKER